MELLGSSRGAMLAFSPQAREFDSKVSLGSGFFTKGNSLLLAPPLPPVWCNFPRNRGHRGTICKQKPNSSGNGRRQRAAGKKLDERTKVLGDDKSRLERKSRVLTGSRKGNSGGGPGDGGSISSSRSIKQNEADELESPSTPSRLLENGDGATAVSALQPLDEVYYPMADLSVRAQPPFRRRSVSAAESSGTSSSSLPNQLEELVHGGAGAETAVTGESANNNGNGVQRKSVEENGRILPPSAEGFRAAAGGAGAVYEERVEGPGLLGFALDSGSEEDEEDEDEEEEEGDYDEWVEVGVDDEEEEEEDEEEEEVEYWEGDLPPMTPEEEEELLREAERELAELEKNPEYESVPSKAAAGAAVAADSALKDIHVQKSSDPIGGRGGDEGPHQLSAYAEERPWKKSESDGGIGSSADFGGRGKDWGDDNSRGGKKRVIGGEGGGASGDEEEEEEEVRIGLKRVDLQDRPRRRSLWEGFDDEDGDEEGEEEEEEEEGGGPPNKSQRGVPAVMRCFDRTKIFVKAGDGGNGVVAFRREKFVPFGGPYGGNGGRGGQVFVEADSSMNSLLPFRKAVHFRAGRGAHGGGKRKEGAVGTDCTVKVPPGTVIREAGPEGKVLMEITKTGQRETLLPGGSGGRGNAAFKTGRNNAPQLAELGETGAEMWVELELKLVADVGIVGVPNAGKSTLLSAISAAKPEIANYPFTTLLPNLGVVALDYDATMVVADLPGLLEGAHTGTGLGHEFLRHTERCRVLVHVVDGMSSQPVEEFEAVRLELELFDSALAEKPFVVAFNKMDVPEASERWEAFRLSLRSKGIEPFCMSAATKQGSSEVVSAAHQLLKEMKGNLDTEDDTEEEAKAMAVADRVRKQRSAPLENFTIEVDKHTRTWQVVGAGLERFTQMTNWEYFESVRRFQRVLSASGVSRALRERGIREGDTVIVAQLEFNWMESEDMTKLGDWKRGTRGSKVWPH